MNPAKLLGLRSRLKRCAAAHPKFVRFLQAANRDFLQEGNILEVSLRRPDGTQIKSNLRLEAEDLALLNDWKELNESHEL